jgi:hypothetical protein
MHSHELTAGRTFGLRFDPGESFFPALADLFAPTAPPPRPDRLTPKVLREAIAGVLERVSANARGGMRPFRPAPGGSGRRRAVAGKGLTSRIPAVYLRCTARIGGDLVPGQDRAAQGVASRGGAHEDRDRNTVGSTTSRGTN